MDDANLVEKLDLKHSCFGKALLLEWRNGKRCCHACFTEYGKIEIFFKKWTLICPFIIQIASSAIGFRLALKGGTLERGMLERGTLKRGTLERGTLERGTLFFYLFLLFINILS
jgi:hypothetical protein